MRIAAALRKVMWTNVKTRTHTISQVYSADGSEDDLMIIGKVALSFENGYDVCVALSHFPYC